MTKLDFFMITFFIAILTAIPLVWGWEEFLRKLMDIAS